VVPARRRRARVLTEFDVVLVDPPEGAVRRRVRGTLAPGGVAADDAMCAPVGFDALSAYPEGGTDALDPETPRSTVSRRT